MALLLALAASVLVPAYAYAQWRLARLYSGVWRGLALVPALIMIAGAGLVAAYPGAFSLHLPVGLACFACLYFLALLAFRSAADSLRPSW